MLRRCVGRTMRMGRTALGRGCRGVGVSRPSIRRRWAARACTEVFPASPVAHLSAARFGVRFMGTQRDDKGNNDNGNDTSTTEHDRANASPDPGHHGGAKQEQACERRADEAADAHADAQSKGNTSAAQSKQKEAKKSHNGSADKPKKGDEEEELKTPEDVARAVHKALEELQEMLTKHNAGRGKDGDDDGKDAEAGADGERDGAGGGSGGGGGDKKGGKGWPGGSGGDKAKANELWEWATANWGYLAFGAFSLMLLTAGYVNDDERANDVLVPITWQTFEAYLLTYPQLSGVEVINDDYVRVWLTAPPSPELVQHCPKLAVGSWQRNTTHPCAYYYFNIASAREFERQLNEAQADEGFSPLEYVTVHFRTPSNLFYTVAGFVIPLGCMVALLSFVLGRMGGMGGMGGMGASRAKKFTAGMVKTRFKDVAGLHEAKQEITEFVSFLKDPKRYHALGARIPKGAMLLGPPGTGKTLLAKAVAGEAGVPFLSISGSDFVEMFVGVGPSRVRDLFKEARRKSPSIVFIDEIDAIGRKRSSGAGSNDERENTLNQLLVEMDGFNTKENVIVLAASNRGDMLDGALMRPGRFDRQVVVDLPDVRGRKEILEVHLKPLTIESELEPLAKEVAVLTPGFSGADLANVCNEAALIAARRDAPAVTLADFEAGIERVMGGLEKKSRVLSPKERVRVAYHEAGHAIVGWFSKYADPLLKVSIVPRGKALGYAQYLPKDKYLYSSEELFDRICVTLGGRIAEAIKFGEISTGAQDDLQRVTELAYALISRYGMNKRLGLLSFPSPDPSSGYYERPYSQATSSLIDEEVRELVNRAYEVTNQLIRDRMEGLEAVAMKLLRAEVLRTADMVELLGERPHGMPKHVYDDLVAAQLKAEAVANERQREERDRDNDAHSSATKEDVDTTTTTTTTNGDDAASSSTSASKDVPKSHHDLLRNVDESVARSVAEAEDGAVKDQEGNATEGQTKAQGDASVEGVKAEQGGDGPDVNGTSSEHNGESEVDSGKKEDTDEKKEKQ